MKKITSIKNKTLKYLIIYSIIILLVTWASQIIFLRYSYEKYQIRNLNKIVSKLTEKSYTNEEIEQIAYENNICINYIFNDDVFLYNVLDNNCIIKNNKSRILIKQFINSDKDKEIIKLNTNSNKKSILYNLKLSNNEYIMLNSSLEDVNSTTSILTNQLIFIVIIIIIISILVSFYLSKILNKHIINITNEAKKLTENNKYLNIEETNIKEINDLKDALYYARNEINKTEELMNDLLANVSHDLKTPLTMIKAYAEMIRDIDDKDKRKENLNIIIDETDRLNLLVNDLLNLSKLESNKDILNIKEFDLIELINSIIKKYSIIEYLENYRFIINAPTKAVVKADEQKIGQVLYNLINNAINYTGDDLLVTIEIKELKKTYLVKIIDTGKGIKDKDIKLIWNKYYKNEKNHKRNKIGTGLGLSIVKNILDLHKMKYGVKSSDNGTTFYFEIKKS